LIETFTNDWLMNYQKSFGIKNFSCYNVIIMVMPRKSIVCFTGVSCYLLFLFLICFVFSKYTSATTASTATATVKVAASCTLTTSGGGNYSATVPNGTSAEIAGSTMSVSCNDAGGFALYAVGYSDDTVGNNNMIGSSVNIATNTSGNDSYWAMKINPTSGTTPTIENSFNNYHIVPDIHTKIASYASSTGTGSLSVNATYKANISSTQLAGNYLGKVKYTLVHPQNEIPAQPIACDPGKICYNPNTNIVEGQMGKQSATNNASVELYVPNYKKQGYGFGGWSDKYDYETNPDAHFYGPNQTITTPADTSTNGLSLYAIWIPSAGSMQSDADTICNGLTKAPTDGSANLSSISALTDDRDGDTYAIAKLADDRCWIIENLRLDDSSILSTLSTNNPALPITNDYVNSIVSNHLSATTDPAQTAWCSSFSTACTNQSIINTNNTVLFINNAASNYYVSSDVYGYGNYYNWYSATAGNGGYGNSAGYTAPGDICPASWHLPTGGDETMEFGILDIALGGTGNSSGSVTPWVSYPNNFIYSGAITMSSLFNRAAIGYNWSSNGSTNAYAYILIVNATDYVGPGTYSNSKESGYTVRCILSQ